MTVRFLGQCAWYTGHIIRKERVDMTFLLILLFPLAVLAELLRLNK